MDGLTEGRNVHFVMPDGEHRAAMVVKVWRIYRPDGTSIPPTNGCSNLTVFPDWANDPGGAAGIMWRTSVLYSENKEPNTWHWIEKA